MKALSLAIATIALIPNMPGARANNAVSLEHSYVTYECGQIQLQTAQPEASGNPTPLVCFAPGNAILLSNTDGLEEKWATIENAPTVEINSKPKLAEHSGYGGKGKIREPASKF